MIVRLYSSALLGVEGIEVEVEVSAFNAEKPAIKKIGLPTAWRDGHVRAEANEWNLAY